MHIRHYLNLHVGFIIDEFFNMLVVENLESQIKSSLQNVLIPAIERCKLVEYKCLNNEEAKELAKDVADTFDKMVSPNLAKLLANAIDYYIKSASITGNIATAGTPAAQSAVIVPAPTPATAGKIPNTLGIT